MLDQLLGGTKQAGSLVDADYLRFDFAAKEPLTLAQLTTLETEVNRWISENSPVTITEMSLEEAKKTWAKAFFEDKYGDIVRVIQIPTPQTTVYTGNSTEFCGGTHVPETSMIGAFKITNQEAVASWIRRLEAVTGPAVALYAHEKEQEQYSFAQLLECTPKQLTEKIQKLMSSTEQLHAQHEQLQQQIIKQHLLGSPSIQKDEFSYCLDITTLWIENIPLKQIAVCARVCRPEKNRLIYTPDGQFALCADASKNAKELQQKYGLKGGWDNQLIQWKDEKVNNIVTQ